ncbi:9298_t:CDS:1, partial [Racocetra persica]
QKEKQLFKFSIDYQEILSLSQISPSLHYLVTLENTYIQIQNPIIELINNSIITPVYQTELISIYKQIQLNSLEDLHFYIDSSIKNTQTPNLQSGIGWILENNTKIKFSANITNASNTTRAELAPIIFILLSLLQNLHIHIHCDNSFTIQILKNLYYYHLTQIKTENWDYLHIINNLLQKKNISLTIYKVKAHSKNILNRNTDILAKR